MQLSKPSSMPKWAIPLLVLAVAVVIVSILSATKPEAPTQESQEKEWLVNTKEVAIGSNRPQLQLLGRVESPFETQLSAGLVADVEEVLVREGQRVAKGELLIKLDDREINLMLKQRESDVEDLKAQIRSETNRYESDLKALESEKALLAITEKAVKRQAKLNESNLVAQERYENAQSQNAQQALSLINRELNIADHPNRLATLKSRLTQAETALDDAKIDLERTSIVSPYNGVITEIRVAPGDRVNNGQNLASLYDFLNTEIRAQVPNRQVKNIRAALLRDEEITANTDNFGQALPLKLKRLSGQANAGGGGVDAFFIPSEENAELILNSTLKVEVDLPPIENTVAVPLSAIYGVNRMYVVNEGRLLAKTVEVVGKVFDGKASDLSLVRSDELEDGQIYITTQLPNAISGLKVKARQ